MKGWGKIKWNNFPVYSLKSRSGIDPEFRNLLHNGNGKNRIISVRKL